MNRICYLLSLIILLFPYTLSAQSPDRSVDRIVVTASRSPEFLTDVPSSIQIIDEEAILRKSLPGENLGTLLGKVVPGLGMPTQSVSNFGQTLRGREILIVIDGIPQTENRQVSRQLNSIPAYLIERIEVVSGASAIYGAGATGGLIHIITKSYSPDSLSSHTIVGTSVASKPLAHSSQTYLLQQSIS
jgi:iron complex outermembrane recepter protein